MTQRFVLEISIGGSAGEDPEEVPRIVSRVANQIREGRTFAFVYDVNGNRVGGWTLGEEKS